MISFDSRATADFWKLYDRLPPAIQRAADKQFARFRQDPFHHSLRLKPVGELWSVRISESYRALAHRDGNTFHWFWIGSHGEYGRLISG